MSSGSTPAPFAEAVEQPLDVGERLATLADEQGRLLEELSCARDAEAEARLLDGDLLVDETAAQEDGRLRKLIEQRLPEVDLPELLIEVDGWTGFSDLLTPLSGNRRRSIDMPAVLYAAILAHHGERTLDCSPRAQGARSCCFVSSERPRATRGTRRAVARRQLRAAGLVNRGVIGQLDLQRLVQFGGELD